MNKHQVFVSGVLGKSWDSSAIRELFLTFGPVTEVVLGQEGTAYLGFKYPEDAAEAIANMNGAEITGVDSKKMYLQVVENNKSQVTSKSKKAVWDDG